ncbi:MAG: hypothetical protein V3U02_12630 [Calditrichia bacterium]
MKKLFLIVLFALVFSACGKTIYLKNDSGDLTKCEVSTAKAMMVGAYLRNRELKNCVKEKELQGYKKVD